MMTELRSKKQLYEISCTQEQDAEVTVCEEPCEGVFKRQDTHTRPPAAESNPGQINYSALPLQAHVGTHIVVGRVWLHHISETWGRSKSYIVVHRHAFKQ